MGLQETGHRGLHLLSLQNPVDDPLLHQKFRSLEALGQLLADGLGDNPGTGKADESSGLRQDDISQHGKAGSHSSGGGVRENRQVEKPGVRMLFHCGRGLCHLHQGDNSLLHSGSAGAAEQHHRQLLLNRPLKGSGDALAHGVAHASHEKSGVADAQHGFHASDGTAAHSDGLLQVSLLPHLRELLLISGIVQGIFPHHRFLPFLESSRVSHHPYSGFCFHPEIPGTFGTDVGIFHHVLLVQHLPALGTFYPQALGNLRGFFPLFLLSPGG